MAPYALLAVTPLSVVAAIGVLWFKVPFNGSVWVVFVGLALFLLISVGLGLLVSLISRTRQQAQQALVFIMIPTMVLSGFIFPIESMPEAIQPHVCRAAAVCAHGVAGVVRQGQRLRGACYAAVGHGRFRDRHLRGGRHRHPSPDR
ncbi:MAG: ABC transporter permease [Actinomycetales bacterium]|uniref:ABC transporter permease n=1 Tax=Candidatus Phosphoribacter hodrii TaxID=2953743 RepID=A0A935M4Q6_9MICO|nr:ABC transporter permease [Candidatus Phosphoribacter hodrii]